RERESGDYRDHDPEHAWIDIGQSGRSVGGRHLYSLADDCVRDPVQRHAALICRPSIDPLSVRAGLALGYGAARKALTRQSDPVLIGAMKSRMLLVTLALCFAT